MKVLVTGGAGFIGSNLVDRLLADGHQVVVIDNESTGRRENVSPKAVYVKGEVTNPDDLELVFREGLDAVCHIAGQVSFINSYTDPTTDLLTNTFGTLQVLRKCIEHRVGRIIYASSMTVYGVYGEQILPTPEDTHCLPKSYYGITKYAGERYVWATSERSDLDFKLNATAFRMYNVYGPRQSVDNPYQGVLGVFMGRLIEDQPIKIFGDGLQTRDFVYIGDVTRAWSNALADTATYNQVINLGSGEQTSINELADHILKAFGKSRDTHPLSYHTGRPGEQRFVQADIHKAKAVLNWEPTVDFATGLAETKSWALKDAKRRSADSASASR